MKYMLIINNAIQMCDALAGGYYFKEFWLFKWIFKCHAIVSKCYCECIFEYMSIRLRDLL